MRHHPNDSAPTTRAPLLAAFATIFGALAFYLLLASNAFAATGGAERVGKNLGHMLSLIVSYTLLGVAGVMAVGMIASRKFSAIGGLLMMVFIVGGLGVAPDQIWGIIKGTWDTLAKGS